MAIKGKGRSKSRGVARPPRREPVPVPVPLARRRWVQVTAAFVLGLAVFLFAIWLTNGLRVSRDEEQAADQLAQQVQALQSWQGEVEAQLGKVGTLQELGPPAVAPAVRSALEALQDEKELPGTTEDLESTAETLAGAADALDAYDLPGTIRDKGFGASADSIISSRLEFVESLHAYRTATLLVVLAAQTDPGPARDAMLKRASETLDTADALMNDAYRRYRLALANAGILSATSPPLQP